MSSRSMVGIAAGGWGTMSLAGALAFRPTTDTTLPLRRSPLAS